MAAPTVSVVVATFNSAATLKCSLESAIAQTFADFEVLVAGDGCTDASESIVAGLGDARLVWSNRSGNSGSQAVPNNEAIASARGRYVAYLGHDDLWVPTHLARLVECADRVGAAFVHAHCVLIAPDGPRGVLGPGAVAGRRIPIFVPPSTWLHRRDLDLEGPLWRDPETLSCPVDHDILLRAARRRVRCAEVDAVTVVKFPSAFWKSYALREGHPQPEALARLRKDPDGEVRRLVDAASARRAPLWESLHESCRSFGRGVRDRWGHVWPFSRMFAWRFQRKRRKLRALRGLPPG